MRGLFYGWLRQLKPGHPDIGLPGLPGNGSGSTDPGYGIDIGPPGIDHELPTPPPGIWPPPTIEQPIQPVPPSVVPPIALPPGSIWPKPPSVPPGKFIVVVWVPGMGWKYVVVDPSLGPSQPIAPGDVAQPKT
jgi:hypothetical protein